MKDFDKRDRYKYLDVVSNYQDLLTDRIFISNYTDEMLQGLMKEKSEGKSYIRITVSNHPLKFGLFAN